MAVRPAILKNEMLFEKAGEPTDDPAGEQRAAERAPFDGLKVTKAEKAERQNDARHQTDAVIAGFALVNVKAEFFVFFFKKFFIIRLGVVKSYFNHNKTLPVCFIMLKKRAAKRSS